MNLWIWKMAWRDSRKSRRRLLLFATSIVFGIAALTAIGSLRQNLEVTMSEQAKALLGADLLISSRQAINEEQDAFLATLGGTQSREITFTSMISFSRTGASRLVQIRALQGGFPFYGTIETRPATAAQEFRDSGKVVVESALLEQFDAATGDSVKIGDWQTEIAGALEKVPGETVAFATMAPRVYMPFSKLEETRLLRGGSLARYKVYFKFDPSVDVTALVERVRPELERLRLSFDTVEERQQDLGRAMTNMEHFLNLISFVALLLGGVGVASAIHVHIKERLATVAILRCLGSDTRQSFAIYVIQALSLGAIGALAGALLGLIVQAVLPKVMADFLPIQLSFAISWLALAQAVFLGVLICFVFALVPLLAIRRVSPLAVFRSAVESPKSGRVDPYVVILYLAIGTIIVLFAISQSRRWQYGIGFAAGLFTALGVLALVANVLTRVLKGRVPSWLPFVYRQGIASIYRPNNRTLLLTVTLGLGTALILTLYLVQHTLTRQLFPQNQHQSGNTVLFDIQSDQYEEIVHLLESQRLPVVHHAPIVTMRLSAINGRSIEAIKNDRSSRIPTWSLYREYRSTYRDTMTGTEKLLSGQWVSRVDDDTSPVPVSLEEGIAKRLNVSLGDEIVFDVQGIPVTTVVASLREVDWRRLHPNFFVVFPSGVLEQAPSFHVIVTHTDSSGQSSFLQREVVRKFTNVSVIDLKLVLQTVDSILSKIGFAIRFMALFTVATGFLVLVGTVLTSRYQRIRESILLRTLGASKAQILRILFVEYFVLGTFAALTGILVSVGATWALAKYMFRLDLALSVPALVAAFLVVPALTILVGLLASRGILRHPPLEVLRSE